MGGLVIPNDWNGEDYCQMSVTVPFSPYWLANVKGQLLNLADYWRYDKVTGDQQAAAAIGQEIFYTIMFECEDDMIKSFSTYSERQSSGVNNGPSVIDTWTLRPLTVDADPDTIGPVTSGEITLLAGRYLAFVKSVFYNTHETKIRLYDLTGAQAVLESLSVFVTGTGLHVDAVGFFEIFQNSVIRLEYICDNFQDFYGIGRSSDFGTDEIYSKILILQLQ